MASIATQPVPKPSAATTNDKQKPARHTHPLILALLLLLLVLLLLGSGALLGVKLGWQAPGDFLGESVGPSPTGQATSQTGTPPSLNGSPLPGTAGTSGGIPIAGTGTPGAPTAPAVTPGGTPPAVVVTISPTSVTIQCGNATTTVTITNPSNTRSANWSAAALSLPTSLTLSPTHGTLPPGGKQTMTISHISGLVGTVVTVVVTSGGLPQSIVITCSL
ncbi:MAG TPA: hypothetical protein VFS83_00695 [Ktedonobacterales bacterium]|nr:hypothetical protein [Ktedonobacterales bacterium]